MRAKAKSKLAPLAKKHFPDSKVEEDSNHKDSETTQGETNMAETDKIVELSQKLEGLATKDELANAAKDLEEKRKSLENQINELKAIKVRELAEKVFAKEVEIGAVKADDRVTRIKTLSEMGEPTMSFIMASYNSLPQKTEEMSNKGEPNPKAGDLSNKEDKLTPDKIEEMCQDLREKLFMHKNPRQAVRAVGPDPESKTLRYIEIEKVE